MNTWSEQRSENLFKNIKQLIITHEDAIKLDCNGKFSVIIIKIINLIAKSTLDKFEKDIINNYILEAFEELQNE